MFVENKDISVVIQGPTYILDKKKRINIINCVNSIKKYLDGAKIIISTWEDERIYDKRLSTIADKIIYLKQPSSIEYNGNNNILKQIYSSKKGIEQVETKYTLKIRSNFILTCKSNYFDVDDDRINLSTWVDGFVYEFALFCLPDCVQFGKTELVNEFWNVNIDEDDFFTQKRWLGFFNSYSFLYNFKFILAQYIGISWVKNRYNIEPLMKHGFDLNYCDFLLFKDVLKNDFKFLNIHEAGFEFDSDKYDIGIFLQEDTDWLQQSSRKQFLKLLFKKYILCFFDIKFPKQLLKSLNYLIDSNSFFRLRSKK